MWRWRMRRVMYVFLPSWPIDRLRRLTEKRGGSLPSLCNAVPADEPPFATVTASGGRRLLAALNPAAAKAGLAPGMPLPDALSFVPGLVTAPADPAADPATVQGLRRVGLRHIGELYPMPRDALARRFGANGLENSVAYRLDQAFGDLPEPLSPLGETPSRRVRLSFAEPIADPADLARAIARLVEDLAARLAREGMGARRLDLGFHRVDGRVEHIPLGTARPSRDPRHLAGLFTARLDTVDPGLGIEDMILAVFAVEKLPQEQVEFVAGNSEVAAHDLAPLLDRLGAHLGLDAISRIEPRRSHIPERASICVPVGAEKGEKVPEQG